MSRLAKMMRWVLIPAVAVSIVAAVHSREYEMLQQSIPDDPFGQFIFGGHILTDGTIGRLGSENITGLQANSSFGSFDRENLDDAVIDADRIAITLPAFGRFALSESSPGPMRFTNTRSLGWSEVEGKPSLSTSFYAGEIGGIVDSAMSSPSRYIAVASDPLIFPTNTLRTASVNVSLDDGYCNWDWCQQTELAAQSNEFHSEDLFFETAVSPNFGGIIASESSKISSRQINASVSTFVSPWVRLEQLLEDNDIELHDLPIKRNVESIFEFRVKQPLSFSLDGSASGRLSPEVSLTGPAGKVSQDFVFGVAEESVTKPTRGVLHPGIYTLEMRGENLTTQFANASVDFIVSPLPEDFYPIASVSTNTQNDLWPVSNLIQGPDVGFTGNGDFEKTASGSEGNWVTDACDFPCDYFESQEAPVLVLDLGLDRLLTEIDVWGYDNTNANGVSEFELRFATDAEGPEGFGRSISYNPAFSQLANDQSTRQPLLFDHTVAARYVEFKATDNFFVAPGDGSQGETPGGDRVGVGEIAFPVYALGTIIGDFDASGTFDTEDIRLLAERIRVGEYMERFDLNSDETLDEYDIKAWTADFANTWIGDSNLDGEFNSSDLVAVFAQNKYETERSATWEEGDWNGDGKFDSGDLVFAFADAGYEKGPRAGLIAVPESAYSVTVLLHLLILCVVQSRRVPGKNLS